MSPERKPSTNANKKVSDFLENQIPQPFLKILRSVALLDFPIIDLERLVQQLKMQGVNDVQTMTEFFSDALQANDFPLSSLDHTLRMLTIRLYPLWPWLGVPFTPLGGWSPPGLGELDYGGNPCSEAVRKFYNNCVSRYSEGDPRLIRCAGQAIRAQTECSRRLEHLHFEPPLDDCSILSTWRYADCVVYATVNGYDPSGCRFEYIRSVYNCRHRSVGPQRWLEQTLAGWQPTLRDDKTSERGES